MGLDFIALRTGGVLGMTEIFILVPGEPVAKGRPRFAKRGNFVQAYTPAATRDYEQKVAIEARRTMRSLAPLVGAVEIDLDLYLPIRPSWTRKRQEMARQGLERPISSSDWDNYAKAVCDAFNGIVWMDDSQVVSARVRKFYCDQPRIVATVRPLDLGLPLNA